MPSMPTGNTSGYSISGPLPAINYQLPQTKPTAEARDWTRRTFEAALKIAEGDHGQIEAKVEALKVIAYLLPTNQILMEEVPVDQSR